MIDFCMSAFLKKQEDKLYRVYVTDCLKAISENGTHLVGANGVVDYGSKMNARWYDLAFPLKEVEEEKQEDTRTCEEIVDSVWSGMNKRKQTYE